MKEKALQNKTKTNKSQETETQKEITRTDSSLQK